MTNPLIKSLYIHIPFCSSICSYCDFYKMIANDKTKEKYNDENNFDLFFKMKQFSSGYSIPICERRKEIRPFCFNNKIGKDISQKLKEINKNEQDILSKKTKIQKEKKEIINLDFYKLSEINESIKVIFEESGNNASEIERKWNSMKEETKTKKSENDSKFESFKNQIENEKVVIEKLGVFEMSEIDEHINVIVNLSGNNAENLEKRWNQYKKEVLEKKKKEKEDCEPVQKEFNKKFDE